MSRRKGKIKKEKERRTPSHVFLENIQGMTNVLMCRQCPVKIFCERPMQCEEEGKIEAKLTMLGEEIGRDELKKLTPPEINEKLRDITDEDARKFISEVLSNVTKDKEHLQKGEGGEEGETGAGDLQETEGVDDGVRETEVDESLDGGEESSEETS